MSQTQQNPAADEDEIDLVAAFLTLFGPDTEEEPEPQPATINWTTPAPVEWTPGGFKLTTTQLNATTSPPDLPLVYTPGPEDAPLGVDTHLLGVALEPGTGYVAEPKQVSLVVKKAPAKIVWAAPAPVTWAPDGFVPGETELNAKADPGGKIAYTHETQGPLSPGEHKITASIADGEPYEAAPVTVTLTVKKAPAKIAWATPAPVTWAPDGFAPGETELNAKADPGGKIAYTHETEGPLSPGEHKITASIAEGEPYEAAPVTVTLTVKKAPATIVWATPAPVPWVPGGFVPDGTQLNADTQPPGLSFDYSGHDGPGKELGPHVLTATLTEPNYEAAPKQVTLVVTPADPQLSWVKATGTTPWKPDLKVPSAIVGQVTNPLLLPLSFKPAIGDPLSLGRNTIDVIADDPHYDQTPKTLRLTVVPMKAEIKHHKEAEVIADTARGWAFDASALKAITEPRGLPLVYNVTAGDSLYPGMPITISLDPAVKTHAAEPVEATPKFVYPEPEEDQPDEPAENIKISKSVEGREYPYGSANTVPHIHKYGADFHIKLGTGERLDLVRNGKLLKDELRIVRGACKGRPRLLATVNFLVKDYE